jgi:hypothetical protein
MCHCPTALVGWEGDPHNVTLASPETGLMRNPNGVAVGGAGR